MAESRTLFSILMQLPWWISALAGAVMFVITQLIFPPMAPFVALPFMALAAYVGFRQMRNLSPDVVDKRIAALRDMQWEAFSTAVTAGYRKAGYEVAPSSSGGYDYTLTRQGRVTLLACRRWKVSQLGIGPLEDLAAAIAREDAYNGICVCAGEIPPKTREFASGRPISITAGAELAALVGAVDSAGKPWYER